MFSDLGETSHCCAGYSIVGAMFTVSWERSRRKRLLRCEPFGNPRRWTLKKLFDLIPEKLDVDVNETSISEKVGNDNVSFGAPQLGGTVGLRRVIFLAGEDSHPQACWNTAVFWCENHKCNQRWLLGGLWPVKSNRNRYSFASSVLWLTFFSRYCSR